MHSCASCGVPSVDLHGLTLTYVGLEDGVGLIGLGCVLSKTS